MPDELSRLTTLEEASLCPKCRRTGDKRKEIPVNDSSVPKGTKVILIYCGTELCPWYDTPWQVTVNPDGSIPAPRDHTNEPKLYAGVEGHDEQAAALIAAIKANAARETKPGAEIDPYTGRYGQGKIQPY